MKKTIIETELLTRAVRAYSECLRIELEAYRMFLALDALKKYLPQMFMSLGEIPERYEVKYSLSEISGTTDFCSALWKESKRALDCSKILKGYSSQARELIHDFVNNKLNSRDIAAVAKNVQKDFGADT